ncbi:proteasome maturation factor UMP1-domain-containing protein [Truncatella angustata]|uniref:Proteasome maturation factor UMP1-domain-containing protein n=1 Tax=Truncatella angustata TaxID=152316 RepID=A0A9P8UZD5_9PEZI|nr:proteasome maturation factor UMP1-domain-containing protein [Truncatella angustata]KAH6660771.1 proteasome maturation factor UMP1-domain-containing protein [Truncatella angustata]
MSMRLVPSANHSSSFTHLKTAGAPSAPGLHDTLRHGVGPTPSHLGEPSAPVSRHPLESRLKAWQSTQDALRMETLRKTFGIAEPIRRGMEAKIVSEGSWRPAALGGGPGKNSVHEDILAGRDTSCDWEDVFTGEEQHGAVGIHDEMERKLRM